MDDVIKYKQLKMHKNFFATCEKAINEGAYLEALLLEYAALESRLEVILGVLGCPCGFDLDEKEREKINISNRIQCLNYMHNNANIFKNDKKCDAALYSNTKLDKWRTDRNAYIHLLYKDATLYDQRRNECKKIAEEGLEYCKEIYREANRLKYQKQHHPEKFVDENIKCRAKACSCNPRQKQEKKTLVKFMKMNGFKYEDAANAVQAIVESEYYKNQGFAEVRENGFRRFFTDTSKSESSEFVCSVKEENYEAFSELIYGLTKYHVLAQWR